MSTIAAAARHRPGIEPGGRDAHHANAFTTNAAGRGSLRVDTIVEEAFSSTVVGTTRVRKELNHVVLWFADPDADNQCFARL